MCILWIWGPNEWEGTSNDLNKLLKYIFFFFSSLQHFFFSLTSSWWTFSGEQHVLLQCVMGGLRFLWLNSLLRCICTNIRGSPKMNSAIYFWKIMVMKWWYISSRICRRKMSQENNTSTKQLFIAQCSHLQSNHQGNQNWIALGVSLYRRYNSWAKNPTEIKCKAEAKSDFSAVWSRAEVR